MTDDSLDPAKDINNPLSLINKASSVLATHIKAIPDEVFELKEEELERKSQAHDIERKLRAAFQLEYERACRVEKEMEITSIYSGICTRRYFYKYIITNSYKLAYIIKPFPEYEAQLEDMLQLGLDEMRKILKQPLKDKDTGKFDHKVAALKIQITEKLTDRRRGAIAQKLQIDQKSVNLNVTKDVSEVQAPPQNMQEIEAKLAALEASEVPAIEYKDVENERVEEI